jgi:DNA excision repair protein ERCC-2
MVAEAMPDYFPYAPRKFQKDIMDAVSGTLRDGSHLVLESSTGSGKTASVLAPAVEYAIGNGKRILYLTRTNAQQRQVIIELRRIREHSETQTRQPEAGGRGSNGEVAGNSSPGHRNARFYCVGLQGRQNMCLLVGEDEKLAGGDSEELGKLCRDRKAATMERIKAKSGALGADTCRYFAGNCRCDFEKVKEWFVSALPFAEEFLEHCREEGLCAHELSRELAKDALVVTAPYVYFFDNFLRINLMNWLGCAIDDIVIIIDEAHNLPEYARELRSAELSRFTLQAAINEARQFNDPEVLKGLKCSTFCEEALKSLAVLAQTYVKDEDGLVPPDEFESDLMHAFSVTSRKLELAAESLVVIGETVRERNRIAGKLPRSYIYAAGAFLFFWLRLDSERFVKLVVGGSNPRLEGYCLDPSVATDILNACHASVSMSGTLRPLEEYRDSIGLPKDSELLSLPSPFPEENLSVYYTRSLTTKYESLERMMPKLLPAVADIIVKTTRNTAFFFPSFELLGRFSGVKAEGKTLITESRELRQAELLGDVQRFKESAKRGKCAVLFAVCGGRLSEGLDFPDKELEVVVVVGIPYPKPTARQAILQRYYDLKFGKGWEYVVKAPTARKLLQSIGRMIRSEKDKGVAVILDSRAEHFREFIKKMKETGNPAEAIARFRVGRARQPQD